MIKHILISDASCDKSLGVSTISVYDYTTKKLHTKEFYKCGNSSRAEKYALELAIKIANMKQYQNVVFKFDLKSLCSYQVDLEKHNNIKFYELKHVSRNQVSIAHKEANRLLKCIRKRLLKKSKKYSISPKEAKKISIKKRKDYWEKRGKK